ncbi:MAG: PAS domain-containing protein [Desulfofustis sp.]
MKISSFNEAAEQMTGWRQDEVLGKPCKTVFKSNICGNSCALSTATANNCNITVDHDVYITRKHGSSFPVRISATPLIDQDNQIIGGVETFRDISDMVQSDLIINAVADGVEYRCPADYRLVGSGSGRPILRRDVLRCRQRGCMPDHADRPGRGTVQRHRPGRLRGR